MTGKLLAGLAAVVLAAAGAAPPTEADVRYGPHERHALDFYRAAAPGPTPVLIFFHGGGFTGGDKRSFAARAPEYTAAGISVVSANYRYSRQAAYPGPMLDGARVVQFVRSKARGWGVDPDRIALSGGSAGATMALWIALHDDLAEPASPDPVARLSTRVACASVKNAPTTMDPEWLRKEMGATEFGAMLLLHGAKTREEFFTPEKRKQALDASPVEHATKDDPPLFLDYAGEMTPTPLPSGARFSAWIRHPRFGALLEERYRQLGLECRFHHRGNPAPEGAELEFLKKRFAEAGSRRPRQPRRPGAVYNETGVELFEWAKAHFFVGWTCRALAVSR